jgi:hypothetical protein
MGKTQNKLNEPIVWKPKKAKRLPKFRKSTAAERKAWFDDFKAIVAELGKLQLKPCDAVQWIREDRDSE